jgi:hypothetical protein
MESVSGMQPHGDRDTNLNNCSRFRLKLGFTSLSFLAAIDTKKIVDKNPSVSGNHTAHSAHLNGHSQIRDPSPQISVVSSRMVRSLLKTTASSSPSADGNTYAAS